ncbi:MAG: N-acetylmuramoyl-L-alanine amidase [Eubacteriales bacterium]|nr:N-acetylmuramoyl-L-alanine amidase [Eubacteriales bacterium]
MPTVFLSPSTQEFNPFYDGMGSEEYYMNLIADAMVPYLEASGITVVRNTTEDTALTSAQKSNAANADFHLAIHSNAAPESLAGQLRGTDVYYYTGSTQGQRAAEIFANNFSLISPTPQLVDTIPTTRLAELRRTAAPAILIEVAYHDNPDDANWIRANIRDIARNLAVSTADYFGVPFRQP